jgi:uncharacterized membrane protein (DUF106 family)
MTSTFLDPVFDPLLSLGPFWAIFIVSLGVSIIITVIYYFMTDQKEMKELKEKTKEYQKEIRKSRDDPKKMMQLNKKAMEVNTKYMMKSLKPTLVTFLPIILIFAWLSGNLAYEPLHPGDEFTITAKFKEANMQKIDIIPPPTGGISLVSNATQTVLDGKTGWTLKAESRGTHTLTVSYLGKQYTQKVTVSDNPGDYEAVEQKVRDSSLKSIKVNLEKVRPLGTFSIFGWRLDWLWTYIILSMVFSLGLRKAFKIY